MTDTEYSDGIMKAIIAPICLGRITSLSANLPFELNPQTRVAVTPRKSAKLGTGIGLLADDFTMYHLVRTLPHPIEEYWGKCCPPSHLRVIFEFRASNPIVFS